MAIKKLSYLDQLAKDEGLEVFQLTDDLAIPPISLKAIETLQNEKFDPEKDIEQILHVLFGRVYDEAMDVIPLVLAPKVMEDVMRHYMGDEVTDEFLKGNLEDE